MVQQWRKTESGLLVPYQEPKTIYGVDLFAGCGGFSLGMERAGIDVVAAVEWCPEAVMTYLYNLGHYHGCTVRYVTESDRSKMRKTLEQHAKRSDRPESWTMEGRWVGANPARYPHNLKKGCRAMVVGDAAQVSGEDILGDLAALGWRGSVDVVFGGPPCQGMSTANSKARPEDPRNNLILEFLRLAHELDAPMFVMENVPPLLEGKKYRDLRDRYFEQAHEYGFNVVANILNAAHYGVPQYRRRAFIMGTRRGMPRPQFPMPSHWGLVCRDGEVVTDHLSLPEDPVPTETPKPPQPNDQMNLF